jgi:hypothetical protein
MGSQLIAPRRDAQRRYDEPAPPFPGASLSRGGCEHAWGTYLRVMITFVESLSALLAFFAIADLAGTSYHLRGRLERAEVRSNKR